MWSWPKQRTSSTSWSVLEQLYEMEAVKEAYLAYVSSMFSAYQVFKTPPALARGGVQLSESSGIRASPRLLSPSEESMHDELILIVGRRGALGHELARWLEKPRAAVLSRLERLLLKPPEVIGEDLASQRALHHTLRALAQEKSRPFVSLLVEVGKHLGSGDQCWAPASLLGAGFLPSQIPSWLL